MFRPRWRKVLADLWGNKTRTLLVVASIAVGVFAIGVITATYVMLKADLNLSYSSSNPANISLITTPLSEDMVDIIRRMDDVADAEAYTTASLRLQTGPESWKTLTLYAFPDYEERAIHRLLSPVGATVPGDREIILEHKTLASLNAAIGDTLDVELPDGTRRRLTIVGAGVDQSEIYSLILGDLRGYVTVETLEWLRQPPLMNQLYVTVAEFPNDKAHIQQVATAVTDRLERAGASVFRTETARQDKHPLDSIIQALIAVLIILGVLIAFLSGSLIANTMSALLSQHLRQIGIMKLVGARRAQITAMYFVLIMSFGLVALAVSMPTASVAAYALLGFIADIVNFVMQDFRVVPQAIIVQIIIGLIVPPAAGILPVLAGSRITVQKAISSAGISGTQQRKSWLDRQLERLRILSRPLLIAIRNTFRRKGRLALTLFTLTLGGAVFIAVFNAQVSLDTKMEQVTRYFGADVQLDFVDSHRIEKITTQALSVPGVERVEVWLMTGADWLRPEGTPPIAVGLIAPPADSALIDPTLLQGRWLLPGDQRAIAVNEAFWNEVPGLKPGDTLRLKLAGREDDWTVVGIFQYTGFDDLVAYANYDYVAGELQQTRHAASYRIVTTEHSLAYQEQVSAQLNAHFRDLGLKVSKAEAGKAFNASVTEVLGILTAVLLVMALMTALVGSIGLTGTMSMNVMERTREIGVMRAIGAHNQIVSKLVIVEGLVIGVLSYGLGAALSFPISILLSNVISLAIFNTPAPFAFTAQGFLIWLIVVIFLSMAASLLPARNATKLTIREVLAYE
ncbi:MAG TPA: FtsX-like permease family protein [Anaerolineae bacterium]|nr:FtsX-like permease family protein [Anaerolineae bacterium]HQI86149.1 FtsX-like permease family protein [Anaerolineae bacterium]